MQLTDFGNKISNVSFCSLDIYLPLEDSNVLYAGLFVNDSAVESGFTQPLLLKAEAENQDEGVCQEIEDGDEDSEGSHEPVTSIVSAYRLLTPSVKVVNSWSYLDLYIFLCFFSFLSMSII